MTEPPSKPRRRWFAFSLRTLLLLVTSLCVTLGWTLHKVRQQGMALAELEKLGCNFEYAYNSPTILERLRGLFGEYRDRNVTVIAGRGSQVTDASLTNLRDLTQLRDLTLDGTNVTDEGLLQLRELLSPA